MYIYIKLYFYIWSGHSLYIQSFSVLIKLIFIFEVGDTCLYISLAMLLHIYFTYLLFPSLFQHQFSTRD